MFFRKNKTENIPDLIGRLQEALEQSDAVIIGAGAGLSTSAGFTYSGERFQQYFSDFAEKYNFSDMYAGGFYPYSTLEEHWAYWSRYIWINRYMNAPKPVYEQLYNLVKENDYFVLTTNVDHCFQKAGFNKHRLFYTQGDYGLFQCSEPCCAETFDNGEIIQNMVTAQGYTIAPDGTLTVPEAPKMAVPDSGSSFWSWVWGTTPPASSSMISGSAPCAIPKLPISASIRGRHSALRRSGHRRCV